MAGYDLIVIGGGTAGLVAAAGGASLGARVALVERDKLGGECLNYGCVPTKALVKSAKVASLMRRAGEYGVKPVPVEVDFAAVMRRVRATIEKAGEPDSPERFRKLGVDVYLGEEASFESPRDVRVDSGRVLRGRRVILATGSTASPPPIDGLDEVGYRDNVSVLGLERLPRSMVVVGAGPVGTEYAQMFARLGSRVSLICSKDNPLPIEEPEVGEAVSRLLVADGVELHRGYRAAEARREGSEKVVVAEDRFGQRVEVRGEEILVAAGRAPTVDGLNLKAAGVELGKDGVAVDERLRTTTEGVYAAGDVVAGGLRFTHAAEYMGRIALQNALFPVKRKADYAAVPWVTFTDPEVARVGMTESEARERHEGNVRSYSYEIGDLDRAITDGERDGFVKIVVGKRDRILGAHIVAPDAGNMIPEVVLAMRKGLPIGELSQSVHPYPTLSEGVKGAADAYYRQKLFSGPVRGALGGYFALGRLLGR